MTIIYVVYILERKSRKTGKISYYVGKSSRFEERLAEHKKYGCNKGYIITKWRITMMTDYNTVAIDFEKRLKKWSHERKKTLFNKKK